MPPNEKVVRPCKEVQHSVLWGLSTLSEGMVHIEATCRNLQTNRMLRATLQRSKKPHGAGSWNTKWQVIIPTVYMRNRQMICPTVYMNRLVDIPNQILSARKESSVQLARLQSYGILLAEE
ncbi:hypothetical protein SADUNF_Sadunf04G0080600 [Salix dunnii]|uniref:Uncharacterized protein n=1 Tax=Salix dunnii TaxID=1413687 RepID=A0A835N0N0_9ROSI|nr:hypothetical protein SADUNF_Sadunf04G0080600 [Salix dunnii]